jgi:hydrogenase small subunit
MPEAGTGQSANAYIERQLIHVTWLTSGLGCDGDSVAMTSASSPSVEDLVQGVLPGSPRMIIYNPILAYETGGEFVESFHRAAQGRLDPFLLVLEGSVPNEQTSGDGHWSGFGVDAKTGQPITVCDWIDRLAPRAAAVLALGTCAAYGGVPAMRGNPTGAMGL